LRDEVNFTFVFDFRWAGVFLAENFSGFVGGFDGGFEIGFRRFGQSRLPGE
jgi:hypothetical protein